LTIDPRRVALTRSIVGANRALAELNERRREIEQSLRDQELELASLDAAREQPPDPSNIAVEGVRTSTEKIALFCSHRGVSRRPIVAHLQL